MNSIQLLDNSTINKIAAGEVVERPSSVVKELVENAIDADASAITVEIREGGISMIRVTDNGNGIPKDQVKTAFIRHATNKIKNIEDLEKIISLGFRGEALASIAAVSQIELVTKTHDELTGISIELAGGNLLNFQDAGCPEGTSIIMKNLFYNVPARRKFLKKPGTESGYISDMMNKIALGHPEISFKYINNDTVILHTSGNNDLATAVFHVYGKEIVKKTEALHSESSGYSLTGLIGKPELSRANRSYENLFINGRYVKSELVCSAVEEAYKTRLMTGKFPLYVLNLKIPPTMVDVNVHPTKLEVRFAEEDNIYQFIFKAVSECLKASVLIPEANWNSKPSSVVKEFLNQNPIAEAVQNTIFDKEIAAIKTIEDTEEKETAFVPSKKDSKSVVREEKAEFYSKEQIPTGPMISSEVLFNNREELSEIKKESTDNINSAFFHNYKIVGQIFNTYWVIEQGSSIFMIDQHAAHERILFEELTKRFQQRNVASQKLLQPIAVNFTPQEIEILNENMELLQKFGFELEQFGETAYAVRSVPLLSQEPSGVDFLTDIIDQLGKNPSETVSEFKINTIATMACKAAVKANDKLSFQEARALVERLLLLENPFTCPHGRPTIIEMTKYELEKKFKRIV